MCRKFIARAVKGKEFLFSKATMIAVPESSAQKIADALNKVGYNLKQGEIWWVYDNDWYYNDYINYEIKSYSPKRNIRVYAR